MNELISVIIPVYNSEKYLSRCLDSVINNTYKNLEIIVVDDGSKDKSGEICDAYAQKDNRITVIHKQNGGTAEARNTALKTASGKYIAFADNDDFIHPNFYEYMLAAIKQTDADVVVCELTRNMPVVEFNRPCDNKAVLVNKHSFILGTYTGDWTRNTAPWNKLYKKELFSDIRFPSGKGYEDAYTTYRLLYKANTIAYLNSTLYYWYENKNSYSAKKDNANKLRFREEAIRLQSEYYHKDDYSDVNNAAKVFYLNQMHLMLWQLERDYVQNETTKKVRRFFDKQAKEYLRKYKNLCSIEEQKKIYDYLFPKKAAIRYKINTVFKH